MEENLANRSRVELEMALQDSSRALQATLATPLHGIDGEEGGAGGWALPGVGQDSKARIWMVDVSRRISLFLQGLNRTVNPSRY